MYSSEVKKTEVLMENFRRAIGIKIKEVKEVFEGQVVSMVRLAFTFPLLQELPFSRSSALRCVVATLVTCNYAVLQTDEQDDNPTAAVSSSKGDTQESAPCPPVRLTLKTCKGSKTLRLHSSINQGVLRRYATCLSWQHRPY